MEEDGEGGGGEGGGGTSDELRSFAWNSLLSVLSKHSTAVVRRFKDTSISDITVIQHRAGLTAVLRLHK